MSRIRLITFDVMNTILKTRVSIGEEYASVARRFGLNLDAGRINQEFPKVFKGLWDTQPNFGASRGISARDWWTTAVQATCDHSGLNLENPETFETVSSVAQALFEHYRTPAPWILIDSCQKLLSILKKQHTLGVISNFDDRLEPLLTELGIRDYFAFVIVSQTVKICKPYPAIFDLALSRAGLADPAMALHVGDNLRLDYKAAKDCDWNALWLCKDPVLREQYPVDQKEVISDLNELSNHPILRV